MAKIPTTNIGMNLLQNEYGGSNPISMNEYYRKTANNGLVDNSKPTAGGYLDGYVRVYPPGTNGNSGQNEYYRKQSYVDRYSNNTTLYGADAGEPIGIPWEAGEPSPRMTREWIWNGKIVLTETPLNASTFYGPGTNEPTDYLGAFGSTRTQYYVPDSYIYVNGSSGALWGSDYGGCQNPDPVQVQNQTYAYSSVGPKTGKQYGPLLGQYGFWAMQSQVFYGLVSKNLYYTAPGTQYLNQTVPEEGQISLSQFAGQEN